MLFWDRPPQRKRGSRSIFTCLDADTLGVAVFQRLGATDGERECSAGASEPGGGGSPEAGRGGGRGHGAWSLAEQDESWKGDRKVRARARLKGSWRRGGSRGHAADGRAGVGTVEAGSPPGPRAAGGPSWTRGAPGLRQTARRPRPPPPAPRFPGGERCTLDEVPSVRFRTQHEKAAAGRPEPLLAAGLVTCT